MSMKTNQNSKFFNENFIFSTGTGSHSGNEFITLEIEKQEEGLLAILKLRIKLDFSTNNVKIYNKEFKLKYFNSQKNHQS